MQPNRPVSPSSSAGESPRGGPSQRQPATKPPGSTYFFVNSGRIATSWIIVVLPNQSRAKICPTVAWLLSNLSHSPHLSNPQTQSWLNAAFWYVSHHRFITFNQQITSIYYCTHVLIEGRKWIKTTTSSNSFKLMLWYVTTISSVVVGLWLNISHTELSPRLEAKENKPD